MIFAADIIVFSFSGWGTGGLRRLVLKISYFKKSLFLKLLFYGGQSDQTDQGMLALNHRKFFYFLISFRIQSNFTHYIDSGQQ